VQHSLTIIYTINLTQKITSHILIEDMSDHLPVIFLLDNVKQKPLVTNNYIRDLKNFSKENFAADLYEQLVESSENQSLVDSQFENFINTFIS